MNEPAWYLSAIIPVQGSQGGMNWCVGFKGFISLAVDQFNVK